MGKKCQICHWDVIFQIFQSILLTQTICCSIGGKNQTNLGKIGQKQAIFSLQNTQKKLFGQKSMEIQPKFQFWTIHSQQKRSNGLKWPKIAPKIAKMAQKRPKKNFWGANFKSARDFLRNEPHIVYVAVLAFIGNFWLFFGFFQNKHLEALKKKFSYIIYTLLYKKIFFSDQNCQSVKKFTY